MHTSGFIIGFSCRFGTWCWVLIENTTRMILVFSLLNNFVFIGHNGGLDHLLTCPEFSVYNIYDKYVALFFQLKLSLSWYTSHACSVDSSPWRVTRFVDTSSMAPKLDASFVYWKRQLTNMSPKHYPSMNKKIIELIRDGYRESGTRYFVLGNFNKMKQLNEGGETIVKMIKTTPTWRIKKFAYGLETHSQQPQYPIMSFLIWTNYFSLVPLERLVTLYAI